MEENSEMIWKIWKNGKSNSERIWKIQKKIVKRYKSFHYSTWVSFLFFISFHNSTYFSSAFSISFRYSTYLSSIFSKSFHYSTFFCSIFSISFLYFLPYFPYLFTLQLVSFICSISFSSCTRKTSNVARYFRFTQF
jgi:hypothetical protein